MKLEANIVLHIIQYMEEFESIKDIKEPEQKYGKIINLTETISSFNKISARLSLSTNSLSEETLAEVQDLYSMVLLECIKVRDKVVSLYINKILKLKKIEDNESRSRRYYETCVDAKNILIREDYDEFLTRYKEEINKEKF